MNPIPPGKFLEPVTPVEGLFDSASNFKTTEAIDMKLWEKVHNYKKFQFELFLENFILLFVSYDVIKFKTIVQIETSYSYPPLVKVSCQ